MKKIRLEKLLKTAMLSLAVVFTLGGGFAFANVSSTTSTGCGCDVESDVDCGIDCAEVDTCDTCDSCSITNPDICGANDTTGPNSSNENEWNINERENVSVVNIADANNDFDIEVGTAPGDVDSNTVVCSVESGDITGDISVDNSFVAGRVDFVNSTNKSTAVALSNRLTGPSSENTNIANINKVRNIDVVNSYNFNNDLRLDANTGGGSIGNNTKVGNVSTGNVDFSYDVENSVANTMPTIVIPSSDQSGVQAALSNRLTGPNSENSNILNYNSRTNIDVENSACFDNNARIDVNTGGNSISNNTVVGNVKTGDINIDYSVSNAVR